MKESGIILQEFLEQNEWSESAAREIFTDSTFIAFCYAYQRDLLKHTKLSIDFIREMKEHMKVRWTHFIKDKMNFYTEDEKEKLKKEFKLVDIGFAGRDGHIAEWVERD